MTINLQYLVTKNYDSGSGDEQSGDEDDGFEFESEDEDDGFGSGDGKDGKDQTVKAKCPTYNTCKTENKCEYELGHPDKKCILKHECSWCRTTLKQSWRHQEWNCKRKN